MRCGACAGTKVCGPCDGYGEMDDLDSGGVFECEVCDGDGMCVSCDGTGETTDPFEDIGTEQELGE